MTADEILDILDIPDRLESNPDLQEYARVAEPGQRAHESSRRASLGPCHACGAPGVTDCLRCDRPVCTNHHHVMYRLCDTCTRTDPDDGDERPQGLGVEWVE